MTDKEKAIVMAYTGACMLVGDKFKIFHEYVNNIMGRPIYTHEMAIKAISDEIKEKAKVDFIALCAEQEPKTGHWITQWNVAHQKEYYYCSECKEEFSYDGETGIKMNDYKYCPNCGTMMESEE